MFKTISKLFLTVAVTLTATFSLHAEDDVTAAYNTATYTDAKTVKANLEKAGFEVLTSYSPAKLKELSVMVFTSADLKALATKKTRGFAAVQRVVVNSETKEVRVTNPEYWLKGFLQDDYKEGDAKPVSDAIVKALGTLTATQDVVESDNLNGYHFMVGMPYYEDMNEIAEGDDLVATLHKNAKKKQLLFEIKLANGSTLVGLALKKRTEKFVKKIGMQNALALPYTVLIEDGKAYALHAKYYVAYSYPLLSMGEFMGIATMPGAVEKDLTKFFKQH
jgi:hypothetical protein